MSKKDTKEELHIIMIWNETYLQEVEYEIESNFKVLKRINVPSLLGELGDEKRNQIMNAIYRYEIESFGTKGCQPFVVFIVVDENPKYEVRASSRVTKPVNLNLYDLKHRLRKGRLGFMHASDNTEECYDVLEVISHIMDDDTIFSLVVDRRPIFKGLTDFFETINSYTKLEYVVQRNFDNYPNDYKLDEHADIDVQVNDYFLFKAIVGGKSSKKPYYEDGGYKFANRVNFNGSEVQVDIRVVGDNYYCEKWEKDMLKTRVLDNRGFYIMDDLNHFYSLLYHALCHKDKVSGTYKVKFLELAKRIGLNIKDEDINNREILFNILTDFMKKNDYEYVDPVEKSIMCRRN